MVDRLTAALALLIVTGLAGCGGGGVMDGDGDVDDMTGGPVDPAPDDPDSLPNTTDPNVDVRVIQLNNSGDLVAVIGGTFDGTTDQTSVDALSLALDAASPLTDGRGYSGALEAGTNFRLIYVPTPFNEVPTMGQNTYNGAAEVLITLANAGDASGTYAGIMDAQIIADFDNPDSSSVTLDNVANATFSPASDPDGGASAYSPTGDELFVVTSVANTQTGLAGGGQTAAELSGFGDTGATASATAGDIELEAGFAGPDAFEIAGGIQVDADTADIRIGFTAEQ